MTKKTPIQSVMEDKQVMNELRARMHSPRIRARARSFNVEPETLERTLDRAIPPAGPLPGIEEAIIMDFGRPALLVRDDTYQDPESEVWKSRLNPGRTHINTAIRAVGRVEILGHANYKWLGTAWLVSKNIAVTNRHVANIFAARQGERFVFLSNPAGDEYKVRVDFKEEYLPPSPPPASNQMEIAVGEVAHIEELGTGFPDLALLRLVTDEGVLPEPIPLRTGEPLSPFVAVIGYPAYDSRNALDSLDRVFGDIYNVKRFAPGMVSSFDDDVIFTHDCSTLGGNSGSVVIDVEDGAALGLHFGGSFHVGNYAVKAKVVEDRVRNLDVSIPVPSDLFGPDEVEVEARSPEDYADREGYVAGFLGSDFAVPLPALTGEIAGDAATLAEGGQELKYTHFSLVMNKKRRLAFFTASNIDGTALRRFPRTDSWYTDPRISKEEQADNFLYKHNDLDRGHLVRRLDPVWGGTTEAKKAQDDTFHYTNAAPQHKDLNQKTWAELEDHILDNTKIHDLKISVFTGPVFDPDDQEYRDVQIPREFWKVITMVKDDGTPSATAYLLSQASLVDDFREFAFGAYKTYQVPVSLIMEKTNLDFGEIEKFDPLGTIEARAGLRGREIRNLREIMV